MKKIIVLSGKPNSGKSRTLRELAPKIFGIEIYKPKVKVDLAISFKYKGKTIAIISIGDTLPQIRRYFDEVKGKFDILICACRHTGVTYDFYKRLHGIDGYEVEFISKNNPTDEERERITSEIREKISKLFSQ